MASAPIAPHVMKGIRMRVELRNVTKGKGVALPVTSVVFESGSVTRVVMETEQRPTVLGLIATGRMKQESGTVTIDGEASRKQLRHRIALVDAPGISEPEPGVTFGGTIAEELTHAGLASNPVAARLWARSMNMLDSFDLPMADVDPGTRIRALFELAALRTQDGRNPIDGIVLVSPDRHGGDPREWMRIAELLAARGLAILIIAGSAADLLLTEHADDLENEA